MNNYREIALSALVRLLVAGPAFGLGWYLMAGAEGGWADAHLLFFGMASFVAAALVMARPVAAFVAEPLGSLFSPGGRFPGPQPMYSIPESKRVQGLHEEAMAGFRAIAEQHPQEVKPYVAMMEIAVADLGDRGRAEAVYRRGMAVLKKKENRRALTLMYEAVMSRQDATKTVAPAAISRDRRDRKRAGRPGPADSSGREPPLDRPFR